MKHAQEKQYGILINGFHRKGKLVLRCSLDSGSFSRGNHSCNRPKKSRALEEGERGKNSHIGIHEFGALFGCMCLSLKLPVVRLSTVRVQFRSKHVFALSNTRLSFCT
jgi:hypothetical protein